MSILASAALVAADKPLNDDTVRPGLIGLFFFVALFVATYFLWRSMNKQLRKVDEHFDEQEAATTAAGGSVDRVLSAQEQIAVDQAAMTRAGRDEAEGNEPPAR